MGGASVGGASVGGASVGGASGASGAALAGGSVCSDVGEVVKTGWASHARFMQPPPRGHGSLRIIPRVRGRSCEERTDRNMGPVPWRAVTGPAMPSPCRPTTGEQAPGIAQTGPMRGRPVSGLSPGGGLFSAPGCPGSIVGAAAFHFRVRDGNGWCHRALTTRTTYYRTSAREPQAPQPLVNTSLERLDGSTAGRDRRSGRAAYLARAPRWTTVGARPPQWAGRSGRAADEARGASDMKTGGAGAPPGHCLVAGEGFEPPTFGL